MFLTHGKTEVLHEVQPLLCQNPGHLGRLVRPVGLVRLVLAPPHSVDPGDDIVTRGEAAVALGVQLEALDSCTIVELGFEKDNGEMR